MGGIASAVSTLGSLASQVGSMAGSVGSVIRQGQGLADMVTGNSPLAQQQKMERNQLQRGQAAQMAGFSADIARQRDQLQTNASIEERRRVEALRRAMARTKANMAGQGIDPLSSGSGEAILLGQINQTETDRQDSQAIDNLRKRALDDNIADMNHRNLLEAANLYDRQRLQRMRG